jgi:8-oxo-dGTP pyrophosphatase MutT (NUDIX family)
LVSDRAGAGRVKGSGLAWPELRAGLTARLNRLGREAGGAGQSDFDLNPGRRGPTGETVRAAVLVAIVERPDGPTVLLTRRADAMSRHAGQIAFPGGRIDPGETPEAAALREAEEEVGLAAERVTLVGRSSVYETVTGFMVTPVVGLVAPPFRLTLNAAEVAEAFEVPLEVILDENRYERRFHDFETGRRYYYAVTYEDRMIWGATAGMLRALRTRLLDGAPPEVQGAA